MKIFRLICVILFLATLLPVGYLLSGPYLDKRALSNASEFCSAIPVGESIDALIALGEREGIVLEQWSSQHDGQEGSIRYIAIFSGFLANAMHCEILVVNKRVQVRFVAEHFW